MTDFLVISKCGELFLSSELRQGWTRSSGKSHEARKKMKRLLTLEIKSLARSGGTGL
jgi:hypothetical protein